MIIRFAAVALLLLLGAGCRPETGIRAEPPRYPDGDPRPVPDTVQLDTVVQVPPPLVDVLWVIDNSCSMRDEQESLVSNFPSFMQYFLSSGLDYHLGVITLDVDTNSDSGRLREVDGRKFIDASTEDPVDTFSRVATVGTDGSGIEKGRGAVFLALESLRDSANAGFYRDDAAIHTVVITDEGDDTDFLPLEEFIAWYRGLKRLRTRRTFSSIVSPQGAGAYNGSSYLEITDRVGGIPWNIDSPEWDRVLDLLGVQASGLRQEFFLSKRPIPSTIGVEVTKEVDGTVVTTPYERVTLNGEGAVVAGDWAYDAVRNSIRFVDLIPEPLSRITITYTLLADSQAPGFRDVVEQ